MVDRTELAKRVVGHAQAIARLEKIVHPLVRADADAFLQRHRAAGAPLAVLDIPLVFETGGAGRVDKIVVVTAPAELQRLRVRAWRGMPGAHYAQRFAHISTPDHTGAIFFAHDRHERRKLGSGEVARPV